MIFFCGSREDKIWMNYFDSNSSWQKWRKVLCLFCLSLQFNEKQKFSNKISVGVSFSLVCSSSLVEEEVKAEGTWEKVYIKREEWFWDLNPSSCSNFMFNPRWLSWIQAWFLICNSISRLFLSFLRPYVKFITNDFVWKSRLLIFKSPDLDFLELKRCWNANQ